MIYMDTNNGSAVIGWNVPSDNGGDSKLTYPFTLFAVFIYFLTFRNYALLQSGAADSGYQVQATTTSLTATIYELTFGLKYYLRVKCANAGVSVIHSLSCLDVCTLVYIYKCVY